MISTAFLLSQSVEKELLPETSKPHKYKTDSENYHPNQRSQCLQHNPREALAGNHQFSFRKQQFESLTKLNHNRLRRIAMVWLDY